MVDRGRPTSVESMVSRIRASASTRERAVVILSNLGGTLPVRAAVRILGVSPTRFWGLRQVALRAVVTALEVRSVGRPPESASCASAEVRRLEREIEKLREDLAFARVREELALLVPRVTKKGRRRRGAGRCDWRLSAGGAATRGRSSPGGSASACARSMPGGAAGPPVRPGAPLAHSTG